MIAVGIVLLESAVADSPPPFYAQSLFLSLVSSKYTYQCRICKMVQQSSLPLTDAGSPNSQLPHETTSSKEIHSQEENHRCAPQVLRKITVYLLCIFTSVLVVITRGEMNADKNRG